jgi:hypothetical protein
MSCRWSCFLNYLEAKLVDAGVLSPQVADEQRFRS